MHYDVVVNDDWDIVVVVVDYSVVFADDDGVSVDNHDVDDQARGQTA